jgi:hypothetical protein
MTPMKRRLALAAVLAAAPFAVHADAPPRQVVVKLAQLSDVEKACVEQLKVAWAKEDNYDDTFKQMTLDTVYHRKEGQGNVVVFQGTAYNDFLQLERATTVTCRVTDKPPYNVNFQIDR